MGLRTKATFITMLIVLFFSGLVGLIRAYPFQSAQIFFTIAGIVCIAWLWNIVYMQLLTKSKTK